MTAHEDAARTARRAAALKDNLKRRKAQARARSFEAPRMRGAPQDEGGAEQGLGSFEAPRRRGAPQDEGAQAGLTETPEKGPNAAKKQR